MLYWLPGVKCAFFISIFKCYSAISIPMPQMHVAIASKWKHFNGIFLQIDIENLFPKRSRSILLHLIGFVHRKTNPVRHLSDKQTTPIKCRQMEMAACEQGGKSNFEQSRILMAFLSFWWERWAPFRVHRFCSARITFNCTPN